MSARDHIHSELMRLGVHTSIAWPLSGRSDADRLALARALVPECAVVDREAMQNEIELLDMWVGDNADRSVSAVHRAMRNIRAMLAASEPTR